MSEPLWQMSAVDLAAGIRDGTFSASEVLASVAERVGACNPALNAITVPLLDAARATARKADAAVAAGEALGPLHGVPVTVKENVDVTGQATPNGLPALAGLIAPDDSPVVRNLLRAGAVVIGRTNTPELSMRATTDNPLRGRTFNPWDPDASPGGSSGGAGSAAAAGFGPIHHGNDIGGSLRYPAFACGVATVKPTFGRVPAFNPSATAERGLMSQLISVQGAICREVRDVRLATRVMSAGDPRDPWWVPAPFEGEPIGVPIKVAVTTESHGYPIHPDIAQGIERAAGWLSDAGYAVERVATPSIEQAAHGWFDVLVSEIAHTLGPVARQHGSDTIQAILDHYQRIGTPVDAAGYRDAIAARTAMTREWNVFLDAYPLVLSPFLLRPMYDWNYDAMGFEQTRDLFTSAMYSTGTNYLSLPCGVVPVGHAAGRPAGVQIIGRRYREDLILDAMEAIEAQAGVLARELWAREAASQG